MSIPRCIKYAVYEFLCFNYMETIGKEIILCLRFMEKNP